MLKEIDVKTAGELMAAGEKVYAVNLDTEDRQLVDLTSLFTGVRILADLPEEASEKKPAGGRRPKSEQDDMTDEEIKELAGKIDRGKIRALQDAGWTKPKIADEFGYTPKTMDRIFEAMEKE